MIGILDYFFYRFYTFSIKTENQWPQSMQAPAWLAVLTFSGLFGFNLASIFIIYHWIADNPNSISFNKIHGIITAMCFYTIGYLIFINNKRYIAIKDRFDSMSKDDRKWRNVIFWIYLIMTFVTLFVLIPIFVEPAIER